MIISGERVRQARELKAMTQAALAKAVGVSQAAIAQIESGAFLASDDLLQEIAKRSGQPIRFFCQDPTPEFPAGSLLFRGAHASMTKRELSVTSRHAQLAYEVYLKLRARLNPIAARIPAYSGNPQLAAREARRALRLSAHDPVPHLLNMLEWNGLIAVVVPEIKSYDAFSLWFQGAPVLSLAADRSGDRARMSTAHELGHLVMHAGKSRFEVDDSEADGFAAEFLMPEATIAREIKTPVTLSSLAALKPRWRVSIQSMIYRANEIGIITGRQYRYLFEQLSAMGWRKKEPVEIAPEKPRAFRQMAEMLYGDPIDFGAMASDSSLGADQLRWMISHFAPKAEAPCLPANVVSLRRSRG
jgi:Zn-dependent peptidase ImmA (M78 family)/DNA-binding XRE family transcriptional regulator